MVSPWQLALVPEQQTPVYRGGLKIPVSAVKLASNGLFCVEVAPKFKSPLRVASNGLSSLEAVPKSQSH